MRTLILTACATALLGATALAPASAAVVTTTSKMTQKATSSSIKGPATPRTAASIDCSKQADAKNLHGKDREKFRRACMKTAK